jgi:hypothetical protein
VKPLKLIAYDLETTRIEAGTPDVLYLTAFARDFRVSTAVRVDARLSDTERRDRNRRHLCDLLESQLLTPDNADACFVGWNSNRFDAYFIAQALLQSDYWYLFPYLTQSNQLRGLRVRSKEKRHARKYLSFQFLDGMAMTGVQTSLAKFVDTFAPELPKHDLDLDEITFDPRNRQHVAYAERDAESLYHAMQRANAIVKDLTGEELRPTIGNLAIRYFMSKLPIDTDLLRRAPKNVEAVIHGSVKRGGFCWVAKPYKGPAWKYDINQAYAAAMRDCRLPCGDVGTVLDYDPTQPGIYLCEFSRDPWSEIPFYYKPYDGVGTFTMGKPGRGWLTDDEVEHLRADGWAVNVDMGYRWSESFNMQTMVDELEHLRSTCAGGPGGPIGTMLKAIGNNAYGKTLSMLCDDEVMMAREIPLDRDRDGNMIWHFKAPLPSRPNDPPMEHIYHRARVPIPRNYQRPQIGSFITAHVRLKLRAAALQMPDAFLYGDTDCVTFDRSAPFLEIHPTRYGAWKEEAAGDLFTLIAKKVYSFETGDYKAKGLKLRELSPEIAKIHKAKDRAARKARAAGATTKDRDAHDAARAELNRAVQALYDQWYEGTPPSQMQTQRQSFVKFIGGGMMFRELPERKGTSLDRLNTVVLKNGKFIPV